MKKWPAILVAAIAIACKCTYGLIDNDVVADPVKEVTQKRLTYCELSHDRYAERGFVDGECDSLLFTSLRGIGCSDINIRLFEGDPGQWYRSPKHNCLATTEADSDISKDMMLGLFSYALWSYDLELVNRTLTYGVRHDWIMGEASDCDIQATKAVLTPELVNNLYNIQTKLSSGKPFPRSFAILFDGLAELVQPTNKGFTAHLQVLHILLDGSLYGEITSSQKSVLEEQVKRQPRNALYQAALHSFTDGDQSAAAKLLLDEKMFPRNALPTSANYCAGYLYQRDERPFDWAPCDNREEHFGTDFIFAAAVVDGTYMHKKWKH